MEDVRDLEVDADVVGEADLGTDGGGEPSHEVLVRVRLDGEPAEGAVVVQGGEPEAGRTNAAGELVVPVRWDRPGRVMLHASAPGARIGAVEVWEAGEVEIDLVSFGPDNEAYIFADPGEPFRRPTTEQCSHCHRTIGDDWYGSVHRTAATNPRLWDLYLGVALSAESEVACRELGGEWRRGVLPGGEVGERCEVAPPEQEGCADCHAPGIDGRLGGRSMLEAEGTALAYGVHCDVCHKVESVIPGAEPGVAGRLRLHRPAESASFALGGGGWLPLGFGPNHDVANPRMGQVQRDHFRDGRLCVGCHELDRAPPGLDLARWPTGRLPLQSTVSEWEAGPMHGVATCVDCHMPADPRVSNGADLQAFWPLTEIGIQGGWPRPAGAVRRHVFQGPRSAQARMVELAVALFVEGERSDEGWAVRVGVRNAGAGHAIPTGEAMRSLIVEVSLACDGVSLPPRGGDVVPSWGGYAQRAGRWEELDPRDGDRLRGVWRPEGRWREYDGVPPFDVATGWSARERGMPIEAFGGEWVWEAGAWVGDGGPPPVEAEDWGFYLIRESRQRAGAPGMGFARVLVDAEGTERVSSSEAVDCVSDNRLMPQREVWTEHHFAGAECDAPEARAWVWYVPYPEREVQRRAWPDAARVVARAQRRLR